MSNWNLLKEGTIKSFSIKEQAESFYKLRPREWVLLGSMLLATIISFAFGGFFDVYSWVGLVTSVATAISLILVDRGFITNYFWGFIGSVAWLIVSIHNNLIGDIFTQIFYTVMQFVGILIWYKSLNSTEVNTAVVSRKISKKLAVLSIIGVIVVYLIVLFTSKSLHGSMIYWDATLLPLGIAGQLLMTYSYRSQWIAWIAIDAINVYIWANKLFVENASGASSMLVLQVVMLIQALYGTYLWFKRTDE